MAAGVFLTHTVRWSEELMGNMNKAWRYAPAQVFGRQYGVSLQRTGMRLWGSFSTHTVRRSGELMGNMNKAWRYAPAQVFGRQYGVSLQSIGRTVLVGKDLDRSSVEQRRFACMADRATAAGIPPLVLSTDIA